MSHKDRLTTFGKQVGFTVEVEKDIVRAIAVPCLFAGGAVGTCTIEKSCDPVSGKPDDRIGGAAHGVRIFTNDEHQMNDGRVYHVDGTPIGNYIDGDGKTWSNISIKKGGQDSPADDESANDLVHRYAKQTVGAISAAGCPNIAFLENRELFKIPNTFESRTALGPIQDRIREQRIAIIGLGGTGAYILDLMAKTPVSEIHLLDDDEVEWHNFMRAPGAPTSEEIELLRKNPFTKVEYYKSKKYASLREGIFAHDVRIDNSSVLANFLSAHPVDFAFIAIDQKKDDDAPRQDVVYEALSEEAIPFIDSGVSISLHGDRVKGAVTTSFYAEGSKEWKGAIPNARVQGDLHSYRNVQLPEVNALATSLAVMEWRRRTEQYVSKSVSFLHKFRLEKPHIVPS